MMQVLIEFTCLPEEYISNTTSKNNTYVGSIITALSRYLTCCLSDNNPMKSHINSTTTKYKTFGKSLPISQKIVKTNTNITGNNHKDK